MNIFLFLKPIFMKFKTSFEKHHICFENSTSGSFHTRGEYQGGIFFFINETLRIIAEFHETFSYKKINNFLKNVVL